MNDFVNFAKISGTHHLKGAVKANFLFEDIEPFINQKVMLKNNKTDDTKILTIEDINPLNGRKVIIKFQEINFINDAKNLLDYEIFIRRDLLDEEEEIYYMSDLINMNVITIEGENIGKVTDIFSTAAHEILVINEGKEEIMIPNIDVFVKEIDFENKSIKVELIEGMR